MGIIYLLLSKFSGLLKMIAVKKCGTIAKGVKNSIKINLVRSGGSLIVSLIVFLFAMQGTDRVGFWISLCSGLFNAFFVFIWILTVERSSLCLTELFCMLGSVVIPLTLASVLYAGESVSWIQWLGSALLFASVFFFTPRSKKKEKTDVITLILLVSCAFANAGTAITQKLYVSYSAGSVACFNLITFGVMSVMFALLLLVFRRTEKQNAPATKFSGKVWIFLLIATVMLYACQFFQTKASGYFSSAVLYPLSYGIGIPLTFLTDIIVFREKATVLKIVGVGLAVAAMVLVNL